MTADVRTTAGSVRGRRHSDHAVFVGIPYAAPPRGAGRFAAPEPHPGWEGVRDATRPGAVVPQPRRDAFGELDMSPYIGPGWNTDESDDCLTLDLWAPGDGRGGLPVMVFVHGGGFVAGASAAPMTDGAAFARDGVVLVSVNYRLGLPGFLHLPDAPDNRGVLDVIAALRWVRENVAAFGGDPGSVTLFGQSAGATVCTAVLASPESEGLLARAILQSGGRAMTRAQAEVVTAAAGRRLGRPATAAALAGVPDEELVAAIPALGGLDLRVGDTFDPLLGLSPFGVVSDEPLAEAAAGRAVDLLVGTNADEGRLYVVPTGQWATTTDEELRALAASASAAPEALLASYRSRLESPTTGHLRSAILGDQLFGLGTRRLVEARGEAGAWMYRFTWASRAFDGQLGSAHATELPFVFGTTGLPALHGLRALLGPDAPPPELAERIHGAWVRFAATGDPGWPRSRPGARSTLQLGASWRLTEDGPP